MSRISPLLRALPQSTARPVSRTVASTPASRAAAAPKPTPKRVAVPATATRLSRAPPKPAYQTPAATAIEDDLDFPLPEAETIDDYAHLAPSSSSTSPSAITKAKSPSSSFSGDISPSPPLTAFPNDGYRPLPTTAAGDGVGLGDTTNDWSTSFAGLSQRPFDKEAANALLRPLQKDDVEIKPGELDPRESCLLSVAADVSDGLLYLPEIKYRRTLNAAFGPGGWGLAPRGETHVGPRIVSREWGLVCLGR